MKWRVEHVTETGSTNTDLAQRAREGEQEGLVLFADSQTAGRGRLGRQWISPPGSSLMFSMLLRPTVEIARWGWLPLLTAVGVAEVVGAGLKWPNDLLLNNAKCAGILAEVAAGSCRAQPAENTAVVVGIGLNVSQRREELPTGPTGLPATSLALEGIVRDRQELAAEVLERIGQRYERWQAGDQQELLTAYRQMCLTLGREVRISLPGNEILVGVATDVDSDGRLIVLNERGEHCRIAAGDVTHVR